MRVVAGGLRGRRIETPPGRSTRPTTDKAREAIFNALGSLGVVRDARVADLYAGSGALGIEALSRGARSCIFVERDNAAVRVLRSNLHTLGLVDRSTVIQADAVSVVGDLEVDLLLADPPYGQCRWEQVLASVRAEMVVAEDDHAIDPAQFGDPDAARWEVLRARRYGRAWVTFLVRPGGDTPAPRPTN